MSISAMSRGMKPRILIALSVIDCLLEGLVIIYLRITSEMEGVNSVAIRYPASGSNYYEER